MMSKTALLVISLVALPIVIYIAIVVALKTVWLCFFPSPEIHICDQFLVSLEKHNDK